MARNLFLTHPPLADTGSVTPPVSNSPRCRDNAASPLEGTSSANASLVHASTEEIVVLSSSTKETVRLQHVSDASSKLKKASLDGKISRESDDSTLLTKICSVNENVVMNDIELKIQEGSSMEASPTCPSIRKVEVSQVAWYYVSQERKATNATLGHAYLLQEPKSAGDLAILFKKDMETNQKVLVDMITETLMQELLDYELSDMVPHHRSSPIKKMKEGAVSVAAPTVHPLWDTSNYPCRPAFTSLVPDQEISDVCVTGTLSTYNDYQNYQAYFDFTTEKCSQPVMGSPEIYRESFKLTSKRLVDKYVKENLEAHGLLCSWSLLELYASGKTLFLVLGKQSIDGGGQEEQLYGKMILEALCECLDKKYLRFCLPLFFLFLQPCLEGPNLKKTLISKVNEHADAACEGGFSLEYILEKSLDEEDWKAPYHDMMEVLHNISEYVMMDIIDNFLHDLMEVKCVACASQVYAFNYIGSASLLTELSSMSMKKRNS